MRWLLYGGRGWIGESFQKILREKGETVLLAESRADDTKAVEKELAEVRPDRVCLLVGRTHSPTCGTIDCLEEPGMLVANLRDNLYSQVSMALLTQKFGIHLTICGTGCVFQYDEQHPIDGPGFDEQALPNFFGSSYSVVKGFTDRLLQMLPVLVLRIRMPISDDLHPRSFITKILKYQKICSITNSMSVLPTLLPVAVDLAVKGRIGVVNLTNSGSISHNEILAMWKEIVDPSFTWQNFTIEEQAQVLKSGRSNNTLNPVTIERDYPDIPPIHEAVRQIIYKIKERKDCEEALEQIKMARHH